MLYKTIVLELLTANPDLHRRLKADPQLLHRTSGELKILHLQWVEQLTVRSPSADPRTLKSRALELAVEQVRGRLSPNDSPASEWVEEHLDGAMVYLRIHTPPE